MFYRVLTFTLFLLFKLFSLRARACFFEQSQTDIAWIIGWISQYEVFLSKRGQMLLSTWNKSQISFLKKFATSHSLTVISVKPRNTPNVIYTIFERFIKSDWQDCLFNFLIVYITICWYKFPILLSVLVVKILILIYKLNFILSFCV